MRQAPVRHPAGRPVTQQDIARALGVSRTVVAKVLNRDPHYRASPETRTRVLEAARRLGYDFSHLRPLRRRQYTRYPVDLPAYVTVRLADGRPFDEGSGRIFELSLGGGRVGNFHLSKAVLPVRPFWIDLKIRERGWSGPTIRCHPIRLEMDKTLSVGLEFQRLSPRVRKGLAELLDRVAGERRRVSPQINTINQ